MKADPISKVAIRSREEAEAALGRLAKATAEQKVFKNVLEQAFQAAREQFQPSIEAAQATIDAEKMALEMWASENAGEFGDKKSLDMLHGTIGFRLGQRQVKLRSGMTWEKVKERLGAFRKGIYLRMKPEVDKEAILRDEAAGELATSDQSTMGVRVAQEEDFFANPKTI
ncbi:MAG: Mu Gam family protein [Pedosphaera sp.]|nr:Mu Gam family protein [Pedosphaera sp.]